MLLQNLTLLTNDTVVLVTNIAPPARTISAPLPVPEMADAAPAIPAIVSPILPFDHAAAPSPQGRSQIIVSTSRPGSLGSTVVYTGAPSINGLEAARRAAQSAAERAQLEAGLVSRVDGRVSVATAAYAETASLGLESA